VTLLSLLLLGAICAPQEPTPARPEPAGRERAEQRQPPAEPQPAKIDPKELARQRARAEQLLRRHGKRSAEVDVLVADYTQRRHTELSEKPLVSSGSFLFVREPACVVFRSERPRTSTTRLTTTRYEVYRPARKRLERFVLDGPELAQGLFAAVGGDAARLLRDFEVRGCDEVAGGGGSEEPAKAPQVVVRLRPNAEAVRKRLAELRITFVAETAELRAIAYRDGSGDLVEIELRALRPDPEDPPSAEIDVAEGTRVLEHRPAKR